jgi:molybdenum cofactor synthesis domain-containing protein
VNGARQALVLTVSDGVAAGARDDKSGRLLAARLAELGFSVEQAVVPDEVDGIAAVLRGAAAGGTRLVISTGGTGLGPRDRTPQALAEVLDYQIPGFGEQMRAYGRARTPLADLSRSLAGVVGGTLVVAMPGSASGAIESLEAIEPLLEHALETLGGHTQHGDDS